jgi:hypothetical protein
MIAAALERMFADPEYEKLAQGLFPEAAGPAAIAEAAEAVCRRHLAADVAGVLRVELSSGALFGLRLSDGRSVALKFHDRRCTLPEIRAVARVQRRLAGEGFPCPPVARDPVEHRGGVVSFELWAGPGRERRASDPAVRDRMAELLAGVVRVASRAEGHEGLRRDLAPRGLWPDPHNNLFDFEATAAGAEWIDALARSARAVLDQLQAGRNVAGHMDWSVKHFRFFDDGRVAMVYDWDSLRLAPEARVVGSAAATFTLMFDEDPTSPPDPAEAAAFVSAYERARGAAFGRDERLQVSAAALYALAYCGRCEHALRASPDGRLRARLRELHGCGYFPV